MEKSYIELSDISKYVERGLDYGLLRPVSALKTARIIARVGIVGEKIYTYTENGILETINQVSDESDMVVSSTSDSFNQWIVPSSVFSKKYIPDPECPGYYKSNVGVQQFVQIYEPISFATSWGEKMKVAALGYLNITNSDDIYGIQKEEFERDYSLIEDIKIKKM